MCCILQRRRQAASAITDQKGQQVKEGNRNRRRPADTQLVLTCDTSLCLISFSFSSAILFSSHNNFVIKFSCSLACDDETAVTISNTRLPTSKEIEVKPKIVKEKLSDFQAMLKFMPAGGHALGTDDALFGKWNLPVTQGF